MLEHWIHGIDENTLCRTALSELISLSWGERALGRTHGAIDEQLLTETVKLLLRGLQPPAETLGAT